MSPQYWKIHCDQFTIAICIGYCYVSALLSRSARHIAVLASVTDNLSERKPD